MSKSKELSIEMITNYMFVPDSTLKADATIVLGMTLWHRPVIKAIEVHLKDLAGTLIFSGGLNQKLGEIEAFKMLALWMELGHSPAHVLIETQSINTYENMTYSKALLEKNGLYTDQMRINIVAINYHMRRAVETFRAVFGNHIPLGIVNYPSIHCHPESWFDNREGKELILTEIAKINRYLPGQRPSFFQPA